MLANLAKIHLSFFVSLALISMYLVTNQYIDIVYNKLSTITKYLYIYISQTRLESQATESYVTISTLQAEREELLSYKEYYLKLTRELEQQNDDLERAKRYFVSFVTLFCDVTILIVCVLLLYCTCTIICSIWYTNIL